MMGAYVLIVFNYQLYSIQLFWFLFLGGGSKGGGEELIKFKLQKIRNLDAEIPQVLFSTTENILGFTDYNVIS